MARSRELLAALLALFAGSLSLRAEHPLPGPHFLNCELRDNGVMLSWDDLGIDPTVGQQAFIARDGEPIAELDPNAVSFFDANVPAGRHLYELTIVLADVKISRECTVEVGGGELICKTDGHVVSLSWPPVLIAIAFEGFLVRRNKELIAFISELSFEDIPPPGIHVYEASIQLFGGDPKDEDHSDEMPIGSCTVETVGGGPLPPESLECVIQEKAPVCVALTWKNPIAYDAIAIHRNGQLIARLDGSADRFVERDPGRGVQLYQVFGSVGDDSSFAASCTVDLGGGQPRRAFLRADVNNDGALELSDGVFTLNWLFLNQRTPDCVDAADANGNGSVDIADPVYTFSYLFLGGVAPPFPFPDCGAVAGAVNCDSSVCNRE